MPSPSRIGWDFIMYALAVALGALSIFKQPKFPYIKYTVIYGNGSRYSFIQRIDKNSQRKIPLTDENENFITNINTYYFQSRKDDLDEQK